MEQKRVERDKTGIRGTRLFMKVKGMHVKDDWMETDHVMQVESVKE